MLALEWRMALVCPMALCHNHWHGQPACRRLYACTYDSYCAGSMDKYGAQGAKASSPAAERNKVRHADLPGTTDCIMLTITIHWLMFTITFHMPGHT